MSNPKIINVTQFEEVHKAEMERFNEKLSKIIKEIAQFAANNSTRTLYINRVMDSKNWDMKDFIPRGGRSVPNISLQPEDNDTSKKASILTYLKHRLDECKVDSGDKEIIKLLKGRLDFLGIQSGSKIAELAALDHILKIENKISEFPKENVNVVEKINEILDKLNYLRNFIKEYSIDTLTDDSPRGDYTSDDIGQHNTKVLGLYGETKKLIRNLSKEGIISEDEKSELLSRLNDSRVCFQHKSNINFDFPTKDQKTKKVRQLTSLSLGLISLTSGIGATTCTAVSLSGVTAPATVPAAAALGLIAGSAGVAALSMTTINSAINYWMYDISPSTNEKISVALGASSLVLSGISFIPAVNNMGQVATVISTTGNQMYTTSLQAYGE